VSRPLTITMQKSVAADTVDSTGWRSAMAESLVSWACLRCLEIPARPNKRMHGATSPRYLPQETSGASPSTVRKRGELKAIGAVNAEEKKATGSLRGPHFQLGLLSGPGACPVAHTSMHCAAFSTGNGRQGRLITRGRGRCCDSNRSRSSAARVATVPSLRLQSLTRACPLCRRSILRPKETAGTELKCEHKRFSGDERLACLEASWAAPGPPIDQIQKPTMVIDIAAGSAEGCIVGGGGYSTRLFCTVC